MFKCTICGEQKDATELDHQDELDGFEYFVCTECAKEEAVIEFEL